jgi:integral membrane protein
LETEKSEGKWIFGQPWPNPVLKARLPWCLRTRSMTRQQAVNAFRWTALAEAVSYLILLGIAMPLKYLWQMPLAVKITGSIHGGLFVLFCATLWLAMQKAAWPLSRAALLFVASLLPLVPFWLDRRVKSWAEGAA